MPRDSKKEKSHGEIALEFVKSVTFLKAVDKAHALARILLVIKIISNMNKIVEIISDITVFPFDDNDPGLVIKVFRTK